MCKMIKKGFIAIEAVIIAAVCIIGGMAGTSAFLKNGQSAQSKSASAINETINMINEEFDFSATEEIPEIVIPNAPSQSVNEYGIQTNKVYEAYVDYFKQAMGLLMDENNTLYLVATHIYLPIDYIYDDDTILASIPEIGNFSFSISEDVIYCNELAINFEPNEILFVIDGDYIYSYTDDYYGVHQEGYVANAIVKNKESYQNIKKEINGLGVLTIAHSAFEGNSNLTEVTFLSDSILQLGENAFGGCTNLKTVIIPNSVIGFGSWAFYNCVNLETIIMPEQFIGFSIGTSLFENCYSLKSIIIPKNVARIDEWAFKNCYSLKEIVISKDLKDIYYEAFENCESLTDIYYEGTEEEWAQINIDPDGNEFFLNATVHFNSTK